MGKWKVHVMVGKEKSQMFTLFRLLSENFQLVLIWEREKEKEKLEKIKRFSANSKRFLFIVSYFIFGSESHSNSGEQAAGSKKRSIKC